MKHRLYMLHRLLFKIFKGILVIPVDLLLSKFDITSLISFLVQGDIIAPSHGLVR